MKKTILIFTLLFSANAFAWVDDSECRVDSKELYDKLTRIGIKTGDAAKRAEKAYKQCICMAGNLAREAAESLTESYEKEMIITEPTARVVTAPIQYGYDMIIQSHDGDEEICYLSIESPEACKNTGFMRAASAYFSIHQTYDAEKNLCVIDESFFNRLYKIRSE